MISIIIPTYNEEDSIGELVEYLMAGADAELITEVIVADGGSTDSTREKSISNKVIFLECNKKGRGAQMNEGAALARGEILYFLHADSHPPGGFTNMIIESISKGFSSGCFRLKFDIDNLFLKVNCWFTRFNVNAFRFGDQSLFVSKEIFKLAGGFDEKLVVFEDQEIISRIRKFSKFKVMESTVTTSARKYIHNGIYRTQAIYFLLNIMYKLGFSQQQLVSTYKKLIRKNNKV